MAGKQLVLQLREQNASVNEIRAALSKLHTVDSWQKSSFSSTFLMVEKQEDIQNSLEQWLHSNDRELNFENRLAYWQRLNLLKSDVKWLKHIHNGGHALYGVQDSDPLCVYTIGLYYWYGFPELVVKMRGGDLQEDMADVGRLLNAAAARMIGEQRAVRDGQKACDVWSSRYADNDDSVFRLMDQHGTSQLGEAVWFYRNFMDTEDFPVLEITLPSGSLTDKLTTAAFENEGNVLFFQHGPVTEKPRVNIGSKEDQESQLALLVSRMMFMLDKREELTMLQDLPLESTPLDAFRLTDVKMFCQAAALLKLETFQKVCEASISPAFDPISESDPICTPLHFAMHHNRVDNMRYLIESFNHPIKGDGDLRSILMDACQYGYEDAVKLLVEIGGKEAIEETDCENWTPLSIAAVGAVHGDTQKAKRIVDFLWEHGGRIM